MDDSKIIQDVKTGDTDAYALLVDKYHRSLLAFIFKIVGDKDVVEDIGQEVFFAVYKSLKNFDELRGVPFSAWIFTIARNRSISFLRQRRTQFQYDVQEIDLLADRGLKTPEDAVLKGEQMLALKHCLQQIPEPFRTTLLMSLEGRSLEEIAVSLDMPLGTVKSRLFRAKDRMRMLVSSFFECKGEV